MIPAVPGLAAVAASSSSDSWSTCRFPPQYWRNWDHTSRYHPRREGAALHLPRRGLYILGTSESERGHMPLRFRPTRFRFLALPLLAALIAAGADASAQDRGYDRRVPASPNEV